MPAQSPYDDVAPFPERFNLAEYFLDHNLEAGRGDKPALLCGSESRTFAQLVERSRRVAAALRRAGVRPEERVLIVLPDGLEFAETWFGVLRAGAVFAMVNPLLKRDDYAYYLEYSKARVVVAHADVLPELGPAAREARLCSTVLVAGGDAGGFDSYEAALEVEDLHSELAATEPTRRDDLAGWLFTSGSTGRPKACVHTHSDFAYSTETYALRVAGYRESDVCVSVPKLFFGYATGTNLMFPFRVGASVALFAERATPDALLDAIERHRATFLTNVPTMMAGLLASERLARADLSSLRVSLSAGEALPPSLYEEWKRRTGVEVLDGIGSAEMFHIYISNAPGDVKPGSLGRIVPGYEAQIVGPDGAPVPDGDPGRLRVRGGSTALCYWADKDKSRSTFQGEWCLSADIFRRDAHGYYYYEGRDDDLLKVSGIFVSPLEIEDALLSHGAVAEVCVVGREDEGGLVKPHAFVVVKPPRKGDEALAAELKQHVKARLAPYKYPRWFEWRAELPKNDRGKVARKELRDACAARGRPA
jgi:benzoate-CoA ligase family protein